MCFGSKDVNLHGRPCWGRGRGGFVPRTGGSVGWASGCHAGGREFDSDRTNTQRLKITEEKVLPL